MLISDLYPEKIPLSSLLASSRPQFRSLLFALIQQQRHASHTAVPNSYGRMESKDTDERGFFRQSVIKEHNAKCSKFSADEDEISTHV